MYWIYNMWGYFWSVEINHLMPLTNFNGNIKKPYRKYRGFFKRTGGFSHKQDFSNNLWLRNMFKIIYHANLQVLSFTLVQQSFIYCIWLVRYWNFKKSKYFPIFAFFWLRRFDIKMTLAAKRFGQIHSKFGKWCPTLLVTSL